jgi:hypothetical protein
MVGFHIAAAVVTLVQLVRLRDRRLLLLLSLFLLQAAARVFGETQPLGLVCDVLSGCAGLALVWVLAPRHHHPTA